ncbi:hypothetical protein DCCM_3397 [Desulfocucumis palustris]|uniref:UPF0291 protein DCCM_3397 n=1 Tax=Desulfocucumis palustris TaxID=1898651 RepID=A0A2L2XDI6_9FIRM|nr:DUF896 domain-containing protein [Desulfocucumis palustris]GBF34285.1 hypothetical protein DCCM_3397 [Desulfocucumis palustris]
MIITKELVDRINYLARKQRDGGLNDDERYEQKKLRELYLEGIRAQLVDALDSMGIKPRKNNTRQNNGHHRGCGCAHCNDLEQH